MSCSSGSPASVRYVVSRDSVRTSDTDPVQRGNVDRTSNNSTSTANTFTDLHFPTGTTQPPRLPTTLPPQHFHHPPHPATSASAAPSDNQSVAYSCSHIYEEVGPPSYHPPYNMEMMTHGHPPAALCNTCCSSGHCSGYTPATSMHSQMLGHSNASAPSLCRCSSTRTHMPVCGHHGSISHYLPPTSQGLPHSFTTGHLPQFHCMSPVDGHSCTLHHHFLPNDPRYNTSTIMHPHVHINDSSSSSENNNQDHSNRSSPFSFLKKCNRDSKVSTNGMLDSSSSKSFLNSCNRKWKIGLAVTILFIILVSIAVGVVVTVTYTKQVSSPPKSIVAAPTTRQLRGSLTVSMGVNSRYTKELGNNKSPEFDDYSTKLTVQIIAVMLKQERLKTLVDSAQVLKLSEGSVIADFVIKLNQNYSKTETEEISELVTKTLYAANNDTNIAFSRDYPISALHVRPFFFDETVATTTQRQPLTSEPDSQSDKTTPSTTTSTTTTTTKPPSTTTRFTIPPQSGVCEPISSSSVCQLVYYSNSGTTFPNFVGHTQQSEALDTISLINTISDRTQCYKDLNTFSCSLYSPKCAADKSRLPPCRKMCEAAFQKCGQYLQTISTLSSINCSQFPDSSDPSVCVGEEPPPVTGSPNCPINHFSCDNHTACHPLSARCDSINDCDDKSDEKKCDNFQCVDGQFKCSNGLCRPKVWRCDGRDDCGDNSDEEGCEPIAPCKVGEFKCATGYDLWGSSSEDVCIDGYNSCDGNRDCSDGSDEADDFCKARGW